MPEPALRIENVSKQYRLGTIGTGTLSHDLNRFWARLRHRGQLNRRVLGGQGAQCQNDEGKRKTQERKKKRPLAFLD